MKSDAQSEAFQAWKHQSLVIFPTKISGRFLVNLFEIPFAPDAAHSWTIPIPGDGEKHFSSRADALEFAMMLVKGVRISTGQNGYLCVQGADGRLRLFTPDLLPVKEEG